MLMLDGYLKLGVANSHLSRTKTSIKVLLIQENQDIYPTTKKVVAFYWLFCRLHFYIIHFEVN
jgi:hypothetical protein